jgi:hypothetical protein
MVYSRFHAARDTQQRVRDLCPKEVSLHAKKAESIRSDGFIYLAARLNCLVACRALRARVN